MEKAILYPIQIPTHSPNSEAKVRKIILGIPKIVGFHSVAWQGRRGNRQGDGEADFILLIPERGILILEVKGGSIEIENGKWFSTGANKIRYDIQDPFEQVVKSKYPLLNYLIENKPYLGQIPLFYGVCFPDITVDRGLTILGKRELILDRNDIADPQALKKAFDKLGQYWEVTHTFSSLETRDLIDLLAPTTFIRKTLQDEISDAVPILLKLTDQQVQVLHALRKNKRAIILGGAGTGKTILGIEKAKQVSNAGLRTLFLSYNSLLKEKISMSLKKTKVEVETFHSLAAREAKKAKITLPSNPKDKKEWFKNGAAKDLRKAMELNQTQYDAIIIDETQDFGNEWIEVLLLLARDTHSLIYFFGDSHQDLYARRSTLPESFTKFELTVNCRNTNPIAKKVCDIFADDFFPSDIDGIEPQFLEVKKPDLFGTHILRVIDKLLYFEIQRLRTRCRYSCFVR